MNLNLSNPADRRRSERILQRIPVRVAGNAQDGRRIDVGAAALVISPHGALLRIPAALAPGTSVDVTLLASGRSEEFRVVWMGVVREDGQFDAGIELQGPVEDFWAMSYAAEN